MQATDVCRHGFLERHTMVLKGYLRKVVERSPGLNKIKDFRRSMLCVIIFKEWLFASHHLVDAKSYPKL